MSTSDPLGPPPSAGPPRIWNGTRVAKFIGVSEVVALKEYKTSIDLLPLSETDKELVMSALKATTERIAEKLVIIALDYGHLLVKNLREKSPDDDAPKDVTRRLILEEDENECSKGS